MLTDTAIRKAIKSGRKCQLSEGAGKGTGRLLLIIRPPLVEWYVQQWKAGKRTLKKLGSYPGMSLEDARHEFVNGYAHDIRVGTIIKRIDSPKAGSLQQLVDDYLSHLSGRPSHEVASYELARFVAFVGGSKAAHAVTQDHVIDFLRPVYARGKAAMADHMRAYIKAAFKWAIERESDYRANITRKYGIKRNPASDIPAEKRVVGERWLTPEELRSFWLWLDSKDAAQLTPHYRAAIKLHIVTGQRMDEIVRINAKSVNRMLSLVEWDWTKTGRAHAIPLPAQGWAILDSFTPNAHGWYFPAVEDATSHVLPSALSEIRRKYVRRTGAAKFESRDIRRSWKTLAGFAKLTKDERDLIQNHAKGDVSSRHYDRYDYLDEKREAMRRWSVWFEVNVENEPPENVVRLAR